MAGREGERERKEEERREGERLEVREREEGWGERQVGGVGGQSRV